MKTFGYLSAVLMAFLFTSAKTTSPVQDDYSTLEPSHNEVIFYEHNDFKGNYFKWWYDKDVRYLTSINMGSTSKSWNDQISSMKIGSNVCVTVWEHTNFTGIKIQMKADGSNKKEYKSMPSGWNDKVSSLKIRMYNQCAKE